MAENQQTSPDRANVMRRSRTSKLVALNRGSSQKAKFFAWPSPPDNRPASGLASLQGYTDIGRASVKDVLSVRENRFRDTRLKRQPGGY